MNKNNKTVQGILNLVDFHERFQVNTMITKQTINHRAGIHALCRN